MCVGARPPVLYMSIIHTHKQVIYTYKYFIMRVVNIFFCLGILITYWSWVMVYQYSKHNSLLILNQIRRNNNNKILRLRKGFETDNLEFNIGRLRCDSFKLYKSMV